MTIRYVGKGGSDANNGLSWATRKLTLNGAEDTPVVAGDVVYVGAGTYRELLTVDVSGGNLATGSASVTASVTQGSPIVIGNGTAWLSNSAPDYVFQTPAIASGVDGVTTLVTGTSHVFTSAAGNFQAGHVGYSIRINTVGAFLITAIGGATSITVAKPDNSSFAMPAGTGLNYNVGPEQPYDILSVDSDTQITLKKPWGAPGFTALQFATYNPIRYIGDYLGQNTDGVGGVVRVTGSDNDQTATRAQCINAAAQRNFRAFANFQFDTTTGSEVSNVGGTYWIIDKCFFHPCAASGVSCTAATQYTCTVQNCYFFTNASQSGVAFSHTLVLDNLAHLVQNCVFVSGTIGVSHTRTGGVTVRNNSFVGRIVQGVSISIALTVGQTITVNNCVIQGCQNGLTATVAGEITENYNAFFANTTNRQLTLTGANSIAYPALFDTRWFFQMVNAGAGPYNPTQVTAPFDLSPASQLINLAGFNPSPSDMRGTAIQNTQRDWGAIEYDPTLSIKARQASSVDGGMVV